eukprot:4290891-Prymnesium_polylepis.1
MPAKYGTGRGGVTSFNYCHYYHTHSFSTATRGLPTAQGAALVEGLEEVGPGGVRWQAAKRWSMPRLMLAAKR